jgi:hypothetical protein
MGVIIALIAALQSNDFGLAGEEQITCGPHSLALASNLLDRKIVDSDLSVAFGGRLNGVHSLKEVARPLTVIIAVSPSPPIGSTTNRYTSVTEVQSVQTRPPIVDDEGSLPVFISTDGSPIRARSETSLAIQQWERVRANVDAIVLWERVGVRGSITRCSASSHRVATAAG